MSQIYPKSNNKQNKLSARNIKYTKIFTQYLDLKKYFACGLTKYFLTFLDILAEDSQVVEAGSRVHVEREGTELPIAIRSPHITGDFVKARCFGKIGNSICQKVVGTGRVVEAPHFENDSGPKYLFCYHPDSSLTLK